MSLDQYHLTDEIEEINGIWFPAGIKKTAPDHAIKHSENAVIAAHHCNTRRYCIQAGGNMGLWPRRFAVHFEHVFTFEPEEVSFRCLSKNIEGLRNVAAYKRCLGMAPSDGLVGIKRESLGSHYLVEGNTPAADGATSFSPMTSIDAFCREGYAAFGDDMPIDLIQLDIEGFEVYALKGARDTLERCKPTLCLEIRKFPGRFSQGLDDLFRFLHKAGYIRVADLPGHDAIYKHRSKINA